MKSTTPNSYSMAFHLQESITVEPESVPQCEDENIEEDQGSHGKESHDPKVDEVGPTSDQPCELDEAMEVNVDQPDAQDDGVNASEIQGEAQGEAKGESQGESKGDSQVESQGESCGTDNKQVKEGALGSDNAKPINEGPSDKVPDNIVLDNNVVPGIEKSADNVVS